MVSEIKVYTNCVKVIYLCSKRQSLNNVLVNFYNINQFIQESMSTQLYKFYDTPICNKRQNAYHISFKLLFTPLSYTKQLTLENSYNH